MGVEELGKPIGARCPHQLNAQGCAIHGRHPAACRAFACEWILDSALPHRFRPDLSKVVLVAETDSRRLIANCDPNNSFAWRREPIRSHLRRKAVETWTSDYIVLVKAGPRLWLITPQGDIDLGDVGEKTPFRVVKGADGSAQVTLGTAAVQ